MAYRRKRRNRGTWFQTIGIPLTEEAGAATLSGLGFQVPVVEDEITSYIQPVTTDAPQYQGDDVTFNTVMGDVIGNEYFLDRIVGKIFISSFYPKDSLNVYRTAPILVGAGFFVARADEQDHNTPIGTSTAIEERDQYSPLEADTIREPWIWRRTWILGARESDQVTPWGATVVDNASARYAAGFPQTTTAYGSVLDGSHIDAKTKRRVGHDDRLFFAVSTSFVVGMGDITPDPELPNIAGYVDYRLHGQLRKARNTGRF